MVQWRIQDFHGGHRPRRGADSQGSYILKILYVKTKESGPLGGVRWARPLDLPLWLVLFIILRHQPFTSVKHI